MANCSMCGKKIGMLEPSAIIKKGSLCLDCLKKTGYSRESSYDANLLAKLSIDEIKDLMAADKDMETTMGTVDVEVGTVAKFNDTKGLAFFLTENMSTPHPHNYNAVSYDQLVAYELIEDGASIQTDAAGAAAIGGLLLGTTGAIIGSATSSTKPVCNSLILKITINNSPEPTFYINLISGSTERTSETYKTALKEAHDIASKLHLIIESRNEQTATASKPTDPVAEIRRYKELADEGIITQEEFEAKKKQLLGI